MLTVITAPKPPIAQLRLLLARALLRFGMSERFQAKACPGLDPGWRPVRVKKTRQIENLEPRFDSIETEKALALAKP
jgi:hypothetical protein